MPCTIIVIILLLYLFSRVLRGTRNFGFHEKPIQTSVKPSAQMSPETRIGRDVTATFAFGQQRKLHVGDNDRTYIYTPIRNYVYRF